MKRSARLNLLMEHLKDGQTHRAEDLAQALGVSLRTIYRDMDTLKSSGVPIQGERGHGYAAQAVLTLPPLNLTIEELEALHLGLAAIGQSGELDLEQAAQTLSDKIDAVLPEDMHSAPKGFGYATYPFAEATNAFKHLTTLRSAIRARQRLMIEMPDGLRHDLRPLKLDYWGRIWTLVGWCDSKHDFASLRVEQIQLITVLPGLFIEEPGKDLATYNARLASPSRAKGSP